MPGFAFIFKKAAISAFVALVLFSLMIGGTGFTRAPCATCE